MGSVAAFAPAALSVAGGLFGGSKGASSAPTPQVFQPADLQNQNSQLLNLMNGQTQNQDYSSMKGNYANTFNQIYSNPFAQGAINSAQNAGQGYTNTGNQMLAASPQLNASALSLLPGIQQMMQTGFDPQNQLYQRMQQQVTDQANVNNAQSGTTNSPYGASVANSANSNFNIDWQNQQLNRQLAAMSGAGAGVQQAGAGVNTAGAVGTAGAGNVAQGGALPYDTSIAQGGNQNAALQSLMQGLMGQYGVNQQSIGNLMSYLGLGATQSNTQAGVDSNTFQNQLQGGAAGGMGGSILGNQFGSGLSSLFGGGNSGSPLFSPVGTTLSGPSGAGKNIPGLPWTH